VRGSSLEPEVLPVLAVLARNGAECYAVFYATSYAFVVVSTIIIGMTELVVP